MIKINVEKIAEIVGGQLYIQNDNTDIIGVSTDSRTIEKHNLYVPLIGARFDGHDFIDSVKEKGVLVTLWSQEGLPNDINVIKVEDTLKALQDLAQYYLSVINPKVIAVTGSNGKTSIKDILFSLLQTRYKVSATKGNFNNEIGLPLTILSMTLDTQIAILEMGMEGLNEISVLSHIAKPDIAVISNIGTAHIKELGSRENIAKAKLEILEGLKVNGLLVVSKNEPLLFNKYPNTKYFDVNEISNFIQTGKGISFNYQNQVYQANLLGKHQVENILACLVVVKEMGINVDAILASLQTLEMTKMRNDFYAFKDVFILDDSYKSNPESVVAALTTLSYFEDRKIAVLSDMLDLGEDEIKYHQDLGKSLVQFGLDKVYFYGPLSRHSYEYSDVEAKYYEDKFELASDLAYEKNCIILFKASRGLKMEEVIERFKEMKK